MIEDLSILSTDLEFDELTCFIKSRLSNKRAYLEELRQDPNLIQHKDLQKNLLSKVEAGIRHYSQLQDWLHSQRSKLIYSQKSQEVDISALEKEQDIDLLAVPASPAQPPPIKTEKEFNSKTTGEKRLYKVSPKEMLKPMYKELLSQPKTNMKDVLDVFFSEHKKPIFSKKITSLFYLTNSELDFKRCEHSISAQLRDGAKEGRWLKLGSSYFAALDYSSN